MDLDLRVFFKEDYIAAYELMFIVGVYVDDEFNRTTCCLLFLLYYYSTFFNYEFTIGSHFNSSMIICCWLSKNKVFMDLRLLVWLDIYNTLDNCCPLTSEPTTSPSQPPDPSQPSIVTATTYSPLQQSTYL